jgi:WD40 repeat protein
MAKKKKPVKYIPGNYKPGDEPVPGIKLRHVLNHGGVVLTAAVTPNGRYALSGSYDETVKIWDLESGAEVRTLSGHEAGVWSLAVTVDGRYALSGSIDNSVKVWDLETGAEIRTLSGHDGGVWSLAVTVDGRFALSGSYDKTVKVWDLESGAEVRTLSGHEGGVFSMAVTASGRYALSGSADEMIKVWDLESGAEVRMLSGHNGGVLSLAVTVDGRYVLSGSDDKTVKIWDLESGAEVRTLEGHSDIVASAYYMPNEKVIMSYSIDGEIRFWRTDTWKTIAKIEQKEVMNTWTSQAFSQTSPTMVTRGSRDVINIWDIDYEKLLGFKPTEESVNYTNAKVVLLGETGVGKSGLAHRLIEDKFVKTSSTHGMKVWRIDLPIEEKANMEREAILWDLAGQDDYRLIHQLFLNETALALMLIKPQDDNPFAGTGDWLKALQTSSIGKAAKITSWKNMVLTLTCRPPLKAAKTVPTNLLRTAHQN